MRHRIEEVGHGEARQGHEANRAEDLAGDGGELRRAQLQPLLGLGDGRHRRLAMRRDCDEHVPPVAVDLPSTMLWQKPGGSCRFVAHPAITDQPLVVAVNLGQVDIQMAHGGRIQDRSIQLSPWGMANILLW